MSRKWVLLVPISLFLGLPWLYRFFEKGWLAVGVASINAEAMSGVQSALTVVIGAGICVFVLTEEAK